MYLVTGANGFLGQIMVRQLEQPYATLSRSNATYRVDLAQAVPELTEAPRGRFAHRGQGAQRP